MPEPDDRKKLAVPEEKEIPKDQLVETKNTVHINGIEISYAVTVGTLVLKEETVKEGEKAGEFEGEGIFHRLHPHQRAGQNAAPGYFRFQRGAWLVIRLAAHGRIRTPAGADG